MFSNDNNPSKERSNFQKLLEDVAENNHILKETKL